MSNENRNRLLFISIIAVGVLVLGIAVGFALWNNSEIAVQGTLHSVQMLGKEAGTDEEGYALAFDWMQAPQGPLRNVSLPINARNKAAAAMLYHAAAPGHTYQELHYAGKVKRGLLRKAGLLDSEGVVDTIGLLSSPDARSTVYIDLLMAY